MNYQSVFKARNRIGKGTFTQAYKYKGSVYIKSVDTAKECIALFCRGYRYLPAITRLEYLDDGSAVYSMPFYNKLTKHHKEAWKQYKILQHFFNHYNYDTEKILLNVDKLKVSTGLKNSLIRLIEMMANYNHYEYIKLELPRNNLGVTKSGRLILLDIIFDVELLRITRKS
ncbi:MAG: hypothetical protein KDC67_05170 [Ignavibacteriae bacterium]|nr:hypothetical protein [Ignavibacteriota bacterium]